MTTPYSDVFDSFMMLIKDYKLIELYNQSPADLDTYLQGFLLFAIDEFDFCNQNLEDRDDDTGIFNQTLSLKNRLMLSKIMVKYWLKKEIQDVLSMKLHIQDRDFKTYAESQNLRAKQDYYAVVCEEISQDLVNYGYKQVNWSDWASGDFGV